MRDAHERTIDYARISVTDRCNLRCVYCMPPEGVAKRRHEDILSYEDIVRVGRAFAGLGIRKIKITGGEPLVRRNVPELVGRLKTLPGIECVTLTTNGAFFPAVAERFCDAGLDGVNISLDALDPRLYKNLTRGGEVKNALDGIDAAVRHGIPSVKINCVPIVGRNEADLVRIAGLARDRRLHVRFIEMMPLGRGAAFQPVGRGVLRDALQDAYGTLEPMAGVLGNGPARYYSLPGFLGAIGFIGTLDHAICGACNRVRLTADGMLKTCLHMDGGLSLKPALASGDDGVLDSAIAGAILRKPLRHEFGRKGGGCGERRHMSEIGG